MAGPQWRSLPAPTDQEVAGSNPAERTHLSAGHRRFRPIPRNRQSPRICGWQQPGSNSSRSWPGGNIRTHTVFGEQVANAVGPVITVAEGALDRALQACRWCVEVLHDQRGSHRELVRGVRRRGGRRLRRSRESRTRPDADGGHSLQHQMDRMHRRAGGAGCASKRDAKVCVRSANSGRVAARSTVTARRR